MKGTLLLSTLITFTQILFAQRIHTKIDSLHSNAAIEKLIRSFDSYEKFSLKPVSDFSSSYHQRGFCKKIADSLNITRSYYKSDFDNNGYTDLLVIGEYYDFSIFVVMNYGHDSLKLKSLTRRSFQECTFPKIICDTMIRYYYMPESDWRDKKQAATLNSIDLIFKNGDFIEYNPHPKNYSIEKIEYQTTMCFGTCPKFYVSIGKDRVSTFKAEAYNRNEDNGKEIKGTFTTTINKRFFSEIINLLTYIDFPNLKNNYAVNWTDDQTSTLTITYDNGKVKQIMDYGLIGTYGLNRVYQLLFDLRFNQNWK